VINYRLASAINPPASPSTNLRFHRSSNHQFCFESASDSRRRPTCCFTSDQIPISPEIASFGVSFGSASDSRRLLPLRSSLRTNFQSFVGHLIFQLTFQPTSDLRRILHRPVLPSNPTPGFRQMPSLPAFLLDRPPTCVRYRILQFCFPINFRLIIGYRVSDFAFRSASGLRRRSTFQLCPPIHFQLALVASSSSCPFDPTSDLRQLLFLRFCQRSTFDFVRSLSPPAAPSTNCQLALTIHLSAVPANQLSEFHLEMILRFACRLNSGFRLHSIFQRFR